MVMLSGLYGNHALVLRQGRAARSTLSSRCRSNDRTPENRLDFQFVDFDEKFVFLFPVQVHIAFCIEAGEIRQPDQPLIEGLPFHRIALLFGARRFS